MLNFFTKNWLAKLVALVIAIVIWFLINAQVEEQPVIIRENQQNESI